jgi:hypothetical protein
MRPSQASIFRRLWPDSLGFSHYVFAAVFLVRLVVLIRLASSPLLLPRGSDMQFYDEWAKQILHGVWTDHHAFYGLPLYPFLLALVYRVFGYGPFVPGLFQAGFDAGTAVLIYRLILEIMTRNRVATASVANLFGVAAAAGWCFFVPAQAYSAILMPTAAAVFAFWLLVWQLVRHEAGVSGRRYFAYGLIIGLSAMGVATILFLVPLFICAILLRGKGPAIKTASIGLLFTGIFSGTAPCWIHNYFVARDPVFLSAHGGINLWLGNNAEATGYPQFPGLHAGQGQMLQDSIEQAETAAGRELKRSEVSRYWSDKAQDFVRRHPAQWAKLLVRKIGNFWNGFEYDDLGMIAALRDHQVIFPGLHFALLAALGIPGAVFSWRPFPGSRWIVGAIALQMLAILPVFVTERYRLAIVPGLLILTALGLERLWRRSMSRKYGDMALQFGVVAISAWLVSLPRHDPGLWALDAYNAGRLALETNDLQSAEPRLLRAYELVPGNAETNLALGNLRLAQGDPRAATDFYNAALNIDPNHKGALNNLGVLALNQNEMVQAIDYFRRALNVAPREAKAHYLLAKALDLAGNRPEARVEAARAAELDPKQPEYKALHEQLRGK